MPAPSSRAGADASQEALRNLQGSIVGVVGVKMLSPLCIDGSRMQDFFQTFWDILKNPREITVTGQLLTK